MSAIAHSTTAATVTPTAPSQADTAALFRALRISTPEGVTRLVSISISRRGNRPATLDVSWLDATGTHRGIIMPGMSTRAYQLIAEHVRLLRARADWTLHPATLGLGWHAFAPDAYELEQARRARESCGSI
jgi:hypothetical protein